MTVYLDFEKPIAALEARIIELQEAADESEVDVAAETSKLRDKADKQLKDIYAKLTAWQKTQVARHPERPHFKHFVAAAFVTLGVVTLVLAQYIAAKKTAK